MANFEQLEKAQVPHHLSSIPLPPVFGNAFPQIDFSPSPRNSGDENEPPDDALNSAVAPMNFDNSFSCAELNAQSEALSALLNATTPPQVPNPRSHSNMLHQNQDTLDLVDYLTQGMDMTSIISPLPYLQTPPPQPNDAGMNNMNVTMEDLITSPSNYPFPRDLE
eukprot:scaffold490917_cov45-Prasinocladus_malaysianus.AAC.1